RRRRRANVSNNRPPPTRSAPRPPRGASERTGTRASRASKTAECTRRGARMRECAWGGIDGVVASRAPMKRSLVELLAAKRDGETLPAGEIARLVAAYMDG